MSPQGSPNQNTITTITDANGEVVIEIRQNEYLVIQNDGSFESYTHYRYITLVDGISWVPQMMWQKPPIYIGVCGICRKRSIFRKRTHGLVSLAKAKNCECGIMTCPMHSILCSDNKWRCPGCAKKYKLKKNIKSLFFAEVKEQS
ncbi:MAG: hypothetical protein ACYC54_12995 [Sedimentisphaerales bacterium]